MEVALEHARDEMERAPAGHAEVDEHVGLYGGFEDEMRPHSAVDMLRVTRVAFCTGFGHRDEVTGREIPNRRERVHLQQCQKVF